MKRDNKAAAILLIVLMVLLLAFCVYVEMQVLSIPMLIVAAAAALTIWRQIYRLRAMNAEATDDYDSYYDDAEEY